MLHFSIFAKIILFTAEAKNVEIKNCNAEPHKHL